MYTLILPRSRANYIRLNNLSISDKEKQLFWNLKFHVGLSTIFSQIILTLNCYSAMVSSWLHLTSHQSPFQENLHTPNARWGRDPGIICPYAKTQDCSIFSTPTKMKYHSLVGTTFWQKPHHVGTSSSIWWTGFRYVSFLVQARLSEVKKRPWQCNNLTLELFGWKLSIKRHETLSSKKVVFLYLKIYLFI